MKWEEFNRDSNPWIFSDPNEIPIEDQLNWAWKNYDTNGDEELTFEELYSALREDDRHWAEWIALFADIDVDGTGDVSWSEL